jgi:short-subunit dehydrogenase
VGIRVQVLCPGIVATEFEERQGFNLRHVLRMSPEGVVTASLAGLSLGEVVCAPGLETGNCRTRFSMRISPLYFANNQPGDTISQKTTRQPFGCRVVRTT